MHIKEHQRQIHPNDDETNRSTHSVSPVVLIKVQLYNIALNLHLIYYCICMTFYGILYITLDLVLRLNIVQSVPSNAFCKETMNILLFMAHTVNLQRCKIQTTDKIKQSPIYRIESLLESKFQST